jgi:4-amino-4-deoxy-L-arabinose transferase-like glycosyltransferase
MSREAWIVVGVVGAVIALATLYGAIVLARRLFVTKRLLGDLGAGGKVAFWGALIYTILPIDLLPDPIYLDDMGVLTAALLYLTHLLRKRRAALPLKQRDGRGSGRSPASGEAPRRGRR